MKKLKVKLGFFSDQAMASYYEEAQDDSMSGFSDTDTDAPSDSQSSSDSETSQAAIKQQVCQYYNDGHCRYGKKCRDLHVCKHFVKGHCRYGAACRLKHIPESGSSSGQDGGGRRSTGKKKWHRRERSSSSSSDDGGGFSGKPYRWQLDLGKGWKDVAHDHILEAQYSRPNTKGIRIYNTPCGALSIDFTKMHILKKSNLRVRRKGSQQTAWLWYYRDNHGWYQYGDKDSNGKASSVSSSQLEKEFQKDHRGVVQFIVDSTTYEIRFKDMTQKNLTTGHKRRIRRRPKYESLRGGAINVVANAFKNLSSSSPKKEPLWQFSGQSGKWHGFTHRGACSVSSADIEAEYQRNPQGSIKFTVNGAPYSIDFSMFRSSFETDLSEGKFEEDDSAAAAIPQQVNASGNLYEWQLFDGRRWSQICNDHIIESNYCQPGARGITIHTSLGSLYIDFDAMTVRGPIADLAVKRQMFLSHNQNQEVGWYYKDNTHWCEYGSQGTSNGTSSVNSQGLEQRYISNPRDTFQFTVGSVVYTMDFSDMTQTNQSTYVSRKVRRRPKFNSLVSANSSSQTILPLSMSTLSINSSTGVTWEFMGDEGAWTEYQKPGCSLDSVDIEKQYQLNPQGQLSFRAGRYTYNLYFSGMFQTNNNFGTKRSIRRKSGGNQPNYSAPSQAHWQFKDMDGSWKDFAKGSKRGSCTVSSQDIETQYQQNSTGMMRFSTGKFNYLLDFSAMIQTNLSTSTKRPVRRL